MNCSKVHHEFDGFDTYIHPFYAQFQFECDTSITEACTLQGKRTAAGKNGRSVWRDVEIIALLYEKHEKPSSFNIPPHHLRLDQCNR